MDVIPATPTTGHHVFQAPAGGNLFSSLFKLPLTEKNYLTTTENTTAPPFLFKSNGRANGEGSPNDVGWRNDFFKRGVPNHTNKKCHPSSLPLHSSLPYVVSSSFFLSFQPSEVVEGALCLSSAPCFQHGS